MLTPSELVSVATLSGGTVGHGTSGSTSGASSLTQGAVVAVIDVLRASTTIAVAMSHGVRAIIPFAGTDETVEHARQYDRSHIRLAGERKMRPIAGFDLGNSPTEYTAEAVGDRTVLMTTTNGTAALLAAAPGAREIVVASYVNCKAVTALLRAALRAKTNVVLVCAGQDRRFALEDSTCAGRYVRLVTDGLANVSLNDAAQACVQLNDHYGDDLETLFHDSAHGRALSDAGYGDDLLVAAQVDAYPVVPIYADRQILRFGTERGR